jgi:putative ABC transport system ATP-binding protein
MEQKLMVEPVFTLRGVRKSRPGGSGYALDIPDLTIMPGETVAITGPSGSGKSTALDVLGMILRPDAAECFRLSVRGETADVAACWRLGRQDALAALRLRHMGYVLQTGGLLPYLNVRQNMGIAASINGMPDAGRQVSELAAALDIERLLEAMPGILSIGERQRVAIGRALASRPAVILADEPTAALDPCHAGAVLDMLLEGARSLQVTLVLVTHDQELVRSRALRNVRIEVRQTDGLSLAVLGA